AYPGVFMLDDASIFKALQTTAKNGGLVCMHAENGSAIDVIVQQALAEGKKAPKYHALTRPTTAEAEATSRAIALAEMAGAPVYIVHLSCNDALEKVREARDRGLPVYAETCPQYLYLSIENFDVPGFEGAKYVFTPPLREKERSPSAATPTWLSSIPTANTPSAPKLTTRACIIRCLRESRSRVCRILSSREGAWWLTGINFWASQGRGSSLRERLTHR